MTRQFAAVTWLALVLSCAPPPPRELDGDGNTTVVGARLASAALATAPTVGPEFRLGLPLQDYATVPELEQAVACNAAGVALVVWSVGSQSNALLNPYFAGTADIYAARVASDGTVLDPDGIPIATTRLGEVAPAVASDGSGWYVTWQGQQSYDVSGIFGARMTSDGDVLDSTAISGPTIGRAKANRAVAYDGTNFLVSWVAAIDGSSGSDVCVARVGIDGTVLDPQEIVIAHAYRPPSVDLAFDGTNWLAVWDSNGLTAFPVAMESTTNVLGAHVNSAGVVVDSFLISDDAGDQAGPAVGCHQGTCFVAWDDQGARIVGASVAGTTVYGGPVIGQSSTGEPLGGPAVDWDGSNWVAAWPRGYAAGQYTVEAARVSSTGTLVDSTPVPLATGTSGVALAQSSSRVLVTWAGPYTYASFLSEGVVTSSFVVSRAFVDAVAFQPAAAASQSNWLAVWRGSPMGIHGTRIGSTGTILDPSGFRLSPSGADVGTAAVASDGTSWFVIWLQWNATLEGPSIASIRGARVAPDGQLPDPDAKLIVGDPFQQQGQVWPRIACDGASWLVTWGIDRAKRVAPDGTVLDPSGIPIGVPTDGHGALAGGEGQWLAVGAVRNDQRSWDVVAQRIANDGTLVDPQPFSIASHVNDYNNAPYLGAAYGSGQWLIVWPTPPSSGRNDLANLYGLRVDASGTVLDSEPIAIFEPTAFGNVAPAIAYDGADWLVTWLDTRAWSLVRLADTPVDIYAARVSTTGELLDSNAFPLASGVDSAQLGTLAGGQRRWLDLYWKVGGPDVGLRARIVEDGCVPIVSIDTTCDGIDDDCDGTADDDFSATPTTCGDGACAAVGTTSCASGHVIDTCVSDLTDGDGDGVPNCADACPLDPGTRGDGCPEIGQGGAGGEGGEEHGGTPGAGDGGVAGSRAGGRGGTAGEGGEAGAVTSAGSGQGGSAGGRGGRAGAAGSTSSHAGTTNQPPLPHGGGCSCGVPAERSSPPWRLGLAFACAGMALRRRRRSPPACARRSVGRSGSSLSIRYR